MGDPRGDGKPLPSLKSHPLGESGGGLGFALFPPDDHVVMISPMPLVSQRDNWIPTFLVALVCVAPAMSPFQKPLFPDL